MNRRSIAVTVVTPMGVSCYATALIGLPVSRAKVWTSKLVPAFVHNHPESWMVDPETGRHLWRTETSLAVVGLAACHDDFQRHPESYKATLIYGGTSTDDVSGAGTCYVTRSFAITGDIMEDLTPLCFDVTGITADRQALQQLLEPHGLWNERAFGIWLVPFVSC
jgi:hypothetical protein